MKNFKRNTIILLIISTIFIYYVVKDNFIETIRLIRGANFGWILMAFILFGLYVFFEAYIMYKVILEYKKDYKFKEVFKLMVMTKFFNGITPFASGGQPIQVYELSKDGIDPSKGTTIVVQTFLIFQFTILILGILSIISNIIFELFVFSPLMYWMTLVGFALNIIAFLTIYIISYNKKINVKINNIIVKIIDKTKFCKNKEKKKEKVNKYFNDYYEGFKYLKQNKKLFINGCFLEAISLIVFFLIPQCVFNALNIDHSLNLFVTTVISTYIFLIGSYIPIPGGTGGLEYGFLTFFKSFTTTGALTSALIVWRFVTYYAPVTVGGIVFNFFKKRD